MPHSPRNIKFLVSALYHNDYDLDHSAQKNSLGRFFKQHDRNVKPNIILVASVIAPLPSAIATIKRTTSLAGDMSLSGWPTRPTIHAASARLTNFDRTCVIN